MGSLIEQLLSKLGLQDEPKLLNKTMELLRLMELKSSSQALLINDYGKNILCIDLAARILGITIDKEQAVKLSGLRKTVYTNQRRLIEKLLDLNNVMSVHDICLKLNLIEIEKKAEELLDFYSKFMTDKNIDIDRTHPQYTTMAVYMASKLCKKRISKTKLMTLSYLRPTQWQQLEQNWNKLLSKYYKATSDAINSKQEKVNKQQDGDGGESIEKDAVDIKSHQEIEDYETWKQRILEMAIKQLEQQANTVNTKCIPK